MSVPTRIGNTEEQAGWLAGDQVLPEGIRICYLRRRQAGPQRPAPSLPAARGAHRRPAAELAHPGRRSSTCSADERSPASPWLPSRKSRALRSEGGARGAGSLGDQQEPSQAPTPRPRGRQKGSKNKGAAKTWKTTTTPGRKPRRRPKKLEEEEESISQESSEEEQCPRRLLPRQGPEGIRICYLRRRQAGPQRPAPSLPAARGAHRRPAAELAHPGRRSSTCSADERSPASPWLPSRKSRALRSEGGARGAGSLGDQQEPSQAPTPRPRGRQKGSKNKGAAKTWKTTTTPGRKPRRRPKKLEEEEESISQESSEEEQCPRRLLPRQGPEGIRICYLRRRQAGPQRPAPSLPAARGAHRRPAAELAHPGRRSSTCSADERSPASPWLPSRKSRALRSEGGARGAGSLGESRAGAGGERQHLDLGADRRGAKTRRRKKRASRRSPRRRSSARAVCSLARDQFPSGASARITRHPTCALHSRTTPPPAAAGPPGRVGSSFPRDPSHPHATPALWTKLTSHRWEHCWLGSWSGGSLLIPDSYPWLPIKGLGRAPLAKKGPKPHLLLTWPTRTVSAAAGVADTHFPSPPYLVLALGWAAHLGAQEGGQEGSKPPTRPKQVLVHLALTLESTAVMEMQSHLYPGRPRGLGGLEPLLIPICFHSWPVSLSLTWGASNKELALPTPTLLLLLTPQAGWVTDYPSPREGAALPLVCCSRERKGACFDRQVQGPPSPPPWASCPPLCILRGWGLPRVCISQVMAGHLEHVCDAERAEGQLQPTRLHEYTACPLACTVERPSVQQGHDGACHPSSPNASKCKLSLTTCIDIYYNQLYPCKKGILSTLLCCLSRLVQALGDNCHIKHHLECSKGEKSHKCSPFFPTHNVVALAEGSGPPAHQTPLEGAEYSWYYGEKGGRGRGRGRKGGRAVRAIGQRVGYRKGGSTGLFKLEDVGKSSRKQVRGMGFQDEGTAGGKSLGVEKNMLFKSEKAFHGTAHSWRCRKEPDQAGPWGPW
ncbi:High mobility group protein HMG-I/HMG-Y [Camelus dromedarius]|uniref:High mobility group protein HMG-I/HMG-Y n=1 Tax=Camelus dromedarius TaxID=9838 RepID=A0A5N4CIA1_CAMDR|nr:High mobility group protein HMG-I/HMG-Y [Camelus dromedarius]